MKAAVYTEFGPPEVLQLIEVEKPAPRENELLIKVYATSVTAADSLMRRGDTAVGRLMLGLRKPRKKILGSEMAGEIEAVGSRVTRFKPGERVFGFTGFRLGAYAEYSCLPEAGSLAPMPANLTFAEAAAVVDGATTALFFLKEKGLIQPGQKVLIIGASGSIGTAAVQLANYFQAEVTGVCSSANVAWVKALGAGKVIDYTREEFTRNGETYDIIFDTVGKSSFSRCKDSLKENGRYLVTAGRLQDLALSLWTAVAGGKKIIFGMSIDKREALIFVKDLIEAGRLKPIIDRTYPLTEIAEAHRYVEKGHKKGNVAIMVRAERREQQTPLPHPGDPKWK